MTLNINLATSATVAATATANTGAQVLDVRLLISEVERAGLDAAPVPVGTPISLQLLQAIKGERGEKGEKGDSATPEDLPDLTLIFDNGLI